MEYLAGKHRKGPPGLGFTQVNTPLSANTPDFTTQTSGEKITVKSVAKEEGQGVCVCVLGGRGWKGVFR